MKIFSFMDKATLIMLSYLVRVYYRKDMHA
jgi:hypothetical protein